jgi:protein-S-isoprenylcysteine O-methyltransferase Ste14
MLPELLIAVFLALCLAVFFGLNLYNLAKSRGAKGNVAFRAEVEMPRGPVFVLAAFGTLVFFCESILYVPIVLLGFQWVLTGSMLQLRFAFGSSMQLAGMVMTGFGYSLFIWSVLARGKYSTSWAMPENHKLVTWGPYRYVLHPSYLAYFILFAGLFMMLLNMISVIPFLAIPGYVGMTRSEEELLIRRFGEELRITKGLQAGFFLKESETKKPKLNVLEQLAEHVNRFYAAHLIALRASLARSIRHLVLNELFTNVVS